jgi:preprotein translocase subunit SecD
MTFTKTVIAGAAMLMGTAALAQDPAYLTLNVGDDSRAVAQSEVVLSQLETTPAGPTLGVELTSDAAQWLTETAAANPAAPMSLSICGNKLSTPLVADMIDGGNMKVTGSMETFEPLYASLTDGVVDCTVLPDM